MSYKVAVVGATGNVGREVLNILAERRFPLSDIIALASDRSVGKEVSFGDNSVLKVHPLKSYDFSGTHLAFFCAGSSIARDYIPKATAQGTIVIDKSPLFRMDPDVPLVVPEINGHLLKNDLLKNIIANPNCVAIPLSLALKPLHQLAPIKRVVISTYQSTSGAGKEAMDELFNQTRALLVNQDSPPEVFTKPIVFNVIPHIDSFNKDGSTGEEAKIIQETQKIVDPSIKLTATCVRVPVFIGHSISATVEFEKPLTSAQAREAYTLKTGVIVIDNPEENGYITPLEIAGEDLVVVSRIRKDPSIPHGLSLWIVGDNLRKGAALNGIQIAETLIQYQDIQKRIPRKGVS